MVSSPNVSLLYCLCKHLSVGVLLVSNLAVPSVAMPQLRPPTGSCLCAAGRGSWLPGPLLPPGERKISRVGTRLTPWAMVMLMAVLWGDQGPILQIVYELLIQILSKYMLFSCVKLWFNHVIIFAHVMTVRLSWHVQNCDLIGSLESKA